MTKTMALSILTAISLLFSPGLSAQASLLPYELEFSGKPFISRVISESSVAVNQKVSLSGGGLDQVEAVFVDHKPASFELISATEVQVEIPFGVNPGDAVLRIAGKFGLESFQNLIEVLPSAYAEAPRVTVGSFQGYVAVYTKNFKGRKLTITLGSKQRVIEALPSNFTQNLTRVGVGKSVQVLVFLDGQLVETRLLEVK